MRGVDLMEANLPGANLKAADLKDVILRLADLTNADLAAANLKEADLERAILQSANLAEANLQMAILVKTDLSDANLSDADLGESDLGGADLTGANLSGALLDDVGLHHAVVTDKQLQQAQTLAGATLPDGKLYDGRFNLSGDLLDTEDAGAALDNPDEMAEFYGITVAQYQAGQTWAVENLKGKTAARKPKSSSRTQPATEDDKGELPPVLGLSRLTSFIDLMDWPFQNRDEWEEYLSDWDNAKTARKMAGWLAATLLWLPLLTLHIPGNIVAILRAYTSNPGALERAGLVIASLAFAAGIFIVGWIMTALAFKSSRNEGVVYRIIALVAAFLSNSSGSTAVGLTMLVGVVIASTLAYLYGSRAARTTTFWVSSLLLTGSTSILVLALFRPLLTSISERNPDSTGIQIGLSVVFIAIAFVISIAVVSMLRSVTRDYALTQLSRQKNTALVAELQIAYFIGLGLLILQIATNSYLWPVL